MKKLIALAMSATVVVGLTGGASAGRPTTVFEDPAGDAGIQGGSGVGQHAIPAFDQAGFDLTSGEITRTGKNLEFRVTSAAMPPSGSLPDGATFRWSFMVHGETFRLSIKSQDIGKPNLLSQEGMDRLGRINLNGHFRLEQCEIASELPGGFPIEECQLIALEEGSFDLATKSFKAILPLTDIGASSGSVIRTDERFSPCQPCWMIPSADRTFSFGFILDGADDPIVYKVPKS